MAEHTQSEVVRLARQLERQLARRRRIVKVLDQLDIELRTTRKFLRDLTEPSLPLPGSEPLPGEQP